MIDKSQEKFPLGEKLKEGLSVQELENFASRYITEVFLIVSLIIAFFSAAYISFFSLGAKTSLFFCVAAMIFGLCMFDFTQNLQKKFFSFLNQQLKTTQVIIGIFRIFIAIFLPFLLFIEIGLLAGLAFKAFYKQLLK